MLKKVFLNWKRLTARLFRDLPLTCYVNSGVQKKVLVMGFKSVEVVFVFSFACSPPESHFLNFWWNNRKVGLQVAVQKIRHHNTIGNYMYDQMSDTREKFDLQTLGFLQNRLLVSNSQSHLEIFIYLILVNPDGKVFGRPDESDVVTRVGGDLPLLNGQVRSSFVFIAQDEVTKH